MAGARCKFCGSEINERNDYRKVTGWERINRSGGGHNAIRVPERSQEFACQWCVDKLARGIDPGQGTLA